MAEGTCRGVVEGNRKSREASVCAAVHPVRLTGTAEEGNAPISRLAVEMGYVGHQFAEVRDDGRRPIRVG